ncbi:MAG: MlaD family protein [Planctomycetota bacterium]
MSKDFFVGLVFLLALGAMVVVSVLVRGFSSQKVVSSLQVKFEQIAGLKIGEPVRVRGYGVGEVEDLVFENEHILVRMKLFRDVQLRAGNKITVRSASALGGNFVDLEPGSGVLLTATELVSLSGAATGDALSSVGEFFAREGPKLSNIFTNLDGVAKNLSDGKGVLGKLISTDAWVEDVTKVIENLRTTSEQLNSTTGAIGMALNDPAFRDTIRDGVNDVKALIDQARNGPGLVYRLLNDPAMSDDVATTVANLRQVSDSLAKEEGLIGALVNDVALREKFVAIIDDVKGATAQLNVEGSPLHTLLNDQGLAQDFKTIAANFRDISDRITTGPGTLHDVVYSEELSQAALLALTIFRESAEDLREQAPINAFLGAIFSAL